MRRIAVLLVPLVVAVLQVTAYAADHWGGAPTGPTPPPAAVAVAIGTVLLMMVALAGLLTALFPGTNPVCAGFVAVGSVAGMYLFLDYFFILILQQWTATSADATLLALLKSAFLMVMVVWGVRCCLNRSARLREALILAIVPVLVSVVLHWAAHSLRIIKP